MIKEFTPGSTEPCGDCGKFAAYIDQPGYNGYMWYERIRVLGSNHEDAEQLRERILAALNPGPEPVEWNGEGLPPVGTVCEVQTWVNREWRKTTVLAHHLGFAVHSWSTDGDDMEVEAAPPGDFRQFRTPEQIAAEEMAAAVKDMIEITSDADGCIDPGEAELLWKAGYRKQVAQ